MTRAWFKPKTYGIGVTPTSWQGWAATAVFCILIVCDRAFAPRLGAILSWTGFAVLIAAFVGLCIVKSERPWRWRWGRND
jgi:hypothetical protein